MRQMDVVSGLINVLTGLYFSGHSNEGVHTHKKKWAGYLFCLQNRCYTCLVASFHCSLCSWMIQPRVCDTKVKQALLPSRILKRVVAWLVPACTNSTQNKLKHCSKMEEKGTVEVKVKLIYGDFHKNINKCLQINILHKNS